MTTSLTHRHQRFLVQGWVRYLQGLQLDLQDRFVADAGGTLTEDEQLALVVDADEQPELFSALHSRYVREFFSPELGRWV